MSGSNGSAPHDDTTEAMLNASERQRYAEIRLPSFADMSSQQRSASLDNIARQVEGLTRQVNALTAKMTQAQQHANDTTFTLEQLQCAVADNALDISRLARIAALLRRIDQFVFKARHAWTMIRYRLARLVKKA